MTDGIVVVDKPAGLTSHDVVARMRRLAGTRRVGHAGTLDPMATGVLIVGIGAATRLLGHLALTVKSYAATIRLGVSTSTDDAEGVVTASASTASVSDEALAAAIGPLTGQIQQVPPGVSAIKVNGQRAYKLARSGAAPVLAARPVTVYSFVVGDVRRHDDVLDVDAVIECSSGTYIRALARDLGAALGCGGHLTALRRTRVGAFGIADAHTLEDLTERLVVTPLASVAAATFPRIDLTAEETRRLSHGAMLSPDVLTRQEAPVSAAPPREGPTTTPAPAPTPATPPAPASAPTSATPPAPASAPVATFAPDGTLVALVTAEPNRVRPLAVFA